MEPSYYELVPGIFVGNGACVDKIPNGIKRIINCTLEYDAMTQDELIKFNIDDYLHLELEDKDDIENFKNGIKISNEFINKISPVLSPVLIHCHMGMSRSACVAMAYVCFLTKCSAHHALDLVFKKRPKAQIGYVNIHYFNFLNKIYF